jgi:LemA protein
MAALVPPKPKEFDKIIDEIKEIDNKLTILKDYYDNNITIYNKSIKIFPSNIVASICKYKEKVFFDKKDMTDEDINDFKL